MKIREIERGEEQVVSELVCRVFDQTVAGDLSREGVAEFYRYASTAALSTRLDSGHHALVAESSDGQIVGVIEIRESRHVSLLFVEQSLRGSGVGQRLLREALRRCQRTDGASEITVNSSLGAVSFYEGMGFRPVGPEQVSNGIRFVPMVANARKQSDA